MGLTPMSNGPYFLHLHRLLGLDVRIDDIDSALDRAAPETLPTPRQTTGWGKPR
jgi:hypothetical protein